MAGTLVANTINTDTGLFSTNNAYTGMTKAWVSFVGSSGAINNSFNVSSVTQNGTGDFTVNFATAMPNANYAYAGMVMPYAVVNGVGFLCGRNSGAGGSSSDKTTTSIRFGVYIGGSPSSSGDVGFQVISS